MKFVGSCLLSMRLRHVALITTLLAVAFFTDCSCKEDERGPRENPRTTTEQPPPPFENLCVKDKNTFAKMIHIIGSVDGQLYAITSDYHWGVYQLTEYPKFGTRSMTVSEPEKFKDKWPELAQSIKEAAGRTNFNFKNIPFDNSVFVKVVWNNDLVDFMLLRGYFGPEKLYFAFDIDRKKQENMFSDYGIFNNPGIWISSNSDRMGFQLFNNGTHFREFTVVKKPYGWPKSDSLFISSDTNAMKVFCNLSLKDPRMRMQLMNEDMQSCGKSMTWRLKKGVHFNQHFYLFSKTHVHYFSEVALRIATNVKSKSFEDFFLCESTATTTPQPFKGEDAYYDDVDDIISEPLDHCDCGNWDCSTHC